MVGRSGRFGAATLGMLLLAACNMDPGRTSSAATDVPHQPALGRVEKPNDPAAAADYFRNLYARDPTNLAAAVGMLQNLREMGSFDQARETAAKLLQGKPNQPALLAELGKIELAAGHLHDAVQVLERAISFDGNDWKSRSALGIAYDRLGQYPQAEASYQAALEISPGNAVVLSNLALSKAMSGDLKGARATVQQAMSGSGADARVRQNYALISALDGDIARAEEVTRRDLPPELARDTISYYRELAAGKELK